MTDLAIIIVSWNVKALLAPCLHSLQTDLAACQLEGEIWVVDNASSDGTVEMVGRDFPQVHLIPSERNLGFAAGNNVALKAIGFRDPTGDDRHTSGEVSALLPRAVLLLNPDTEVHPGALRPMYDFLIGGPGVGVVGPGLVFGDGAFQHSAFATPGLWQLVFDLFPTPGRLAESRLNGRYPRALYEQRQPFKIGHPLGAAMMVKREAIQQVGVLDETYHMYVEEVDWGRRISAAGWAAYCVPAAKITHFGGQSTGQIQRRSFLNLWASRYHFYRQHYSPLKVWAAAQIVRLGMQYKARQDHKALREKQLSPTDLSDRKACYQQVIDIWLGKTRQLSSEL